MTYKMTVRTAGKNDSWEEEIDSVFVTEDSPHFSTHEVGMHSGINMESCEMAEHYGRNIIDFFNRTLRQHESAREFVGVIEVPDE